MVVPFLQPLHHIVPVDYSMVASIVIEAVTCSLHTAVQHLCLCLDLYYVQVSS